MAKTNLLHLQSLHLKLRKKKIEKRLTLNLRKWFVVVVAGGSLKRMNGARPRRAICSNWVQNQPWYGVFVSLSDTGQNRTTPNHVFALVSILVTF